MEILDTVAIGQRLDVDTGHTVQWGFLFQLARNDLANTLQAMGEITPWRRHPAFVRLRFAIDVTTRAPWLVVGNPYGEQSAVPLTAEGITYLLRKESDR